MGGALFISYSHVDRRWMQAIRMHLEGAMQAQCRVWTDRNIRPGATWESVLLTALKGAGTALVLVSPEYLVSPWCRRELASLHQARMKGDLAAVYWLLLRPCAWSWTELHDLQAVQEPPTLALESLPPGLERDQMLVELCARVTTDALQLSTEEDPDVRSVRELLLRADEATPYRPTRILGKDSSNFSIVCRGLDKNDDDVVIKVLTNTPLHRLQTLFMRVARQRKEVVDPSVLRVHRVFTVDAGQAERIVIVSELARDETLGSLLAQDQQKTEEAERTLRPDRVGVILRRLASALSKLHDLAPVPSEGLEARDYLHIFGPLPPDSVFWDERSERPMLSLVGVTSFLWHFFDPDTFTRMITPKGGTYVVPEKRNGQAMDQRADQYFLGMLALELLECERVFAQVPAPAPLTVLRNSRKLWTRHQQLVALLERLLQDDPDQRFASMREVTSQLASLEEPHRVLAKYAYRQWVEPLGMQFSQAFYTRFFQDDKASRAIFERALGPRAAGLILVDDAHHNKLVGSLGKVLNYRRGSPPSSIDDLVPSHRDKGITIEHLRHFREAFLKTLEAQIDASDPEKRAVVDAWRQLFEPVLDAMASMLEPKAPG
ncbi:TIR domain-containing protein [Pseudorhodoferax sp. Leaf267]|uniref:TIR domain-containing protein n=1 Tax=Pseudorhodoferax sp. Leaf267 TaxID=1736316 RepID=UPI0006F54519|nr:TIR domain-containing protein [Pseudorhodoferax sp. Leaf267]KQP23238.1 hypothetical protein ASF43_05025 [Pseudorhodoferax sp. Leaf267]